MESSRKDELERKRQKLAELRRLRESREALLTSPRKDAEISTNDKENINELVASLVGDYKPNKLRNVPDPSATLDTLKEKSIVLDEKKVECSVKSPQNKKLYKPTLTTNDFVLFDLPPKEKITYSKEIQTLETPISPKDIPQKALDDIIEKKEKEFEAKLQDMLEDEKKRIIENLKKESKPQLKDMEETEKQKILESEEFRGFFEQSSKVIERALFEKYDFTINYTEDDGLNGANSDQQVSLSKVFYDEKWCKNMSVTDMQWSKKFPELLLCSYSKGSQASINNDGLALIWNLHMPSRPEFIFRSQSDVLSIQYSPFHPNMFVGGTQSGQIVLWDTRAKSQPVLKTPSASGHTHPVYTMQMVGTANAHNLVSASTDGLVCTWDLNMLTTPQQTLELIHPSSHRTDDVAITSLSFPQNESTSFWVGTEEGTIFHANRLDRAGSKAGINTNDIYKGHFGPITGLQFHPVQNGPFDTSDIFLSSSVDWSIKLWRASSLAKPSLTPTERLPLASFEDSTDYVFDIMWSPVHPSVFASVNASGLLDIWNLNSDLEVPLISTMVEYPSTSTATSLPNVATALNKLQWDHEGKRIAVGNVDGATIVYDISELSFPTNDDWNLFQKSLHELAATV